MRFLIINACFIKQSPPDIIRHATIVYARGGWWGEGGERQQSRKTHGSRRAGGNERGSRVGKLRIHSHDCQRIKRKNHTAH